MPVQACSWLIRLSINRYQPQCGKLEYMAAVCVASVVSNIKGAQDEDLAKTCRWLSFCDKCTYVCVPASTKFIWQVATNDAQGRMPHAQGSRSQTQAASKCLGA